MSAEEKMTKSEELDLLAKATMKLNVDAPVFVPSFVPSFTPSSNTMIKDEEKNNDNNVMDDWDADEDMEDDVDEVIEDENNQEIGQEGKMKAKRKPKKRAKKISECSDQGVKKEHLNVVFIGHVDAGKSTIGGQLLYLTGMVDKRTLEKYEREAKEKNRESWYLSWALDTNQEERDKGKTVEVGRAFFETEHKHFTLLDAPGHRGFVPNMMVGACQADLGVLVISARKGEFETGFERGGQTREHATLAKTAGVKFLIVLINKMDDPTVQWSEDRYNECREKLLPFLKKSYNVKTEVYFMPCSGLTGAYLSDNNKAGSSWYTGPSFLGFLDAMEPFYRKDDGPFRLPVSGKYKDMGTVVCGKVESGSAKRGTQLILMPNRKQVEVIQMWKHDDEVYQIMCGENVTIKLKGVEEEEISSGFVLCELNNICSVGKIFDAQVLILEHKSIICPGYSPILHVHTSCEQVSVKAILCTIDKKSGEKSKTRPRFVKQDQVAIMRFEVLGGLICLETFNKFQQLARITLRDEGRTVAIGKILRVVE